MDWNAVWQPEIKDRFDKLRQQSSEAVVDVGGSSPRRCKESAYRPSVPPNPSP